jgi:hypothetical protein
MRRGAFPRILRIKRNRSEGGTERRVTALQSNGDWPQFAEDDEAQRPTRIKLFRHAKPYHPEALRPTGSTLPLNVTPNLILSLVLSPLVARVYLPYLSDSSIERTEQ